MKGSLSEELFVTRTIDPSFSTKPINPAMTDAQSSLMGCAIEGPDDPEGPGGGIPIEPEPEPATAGKTEVSSFAEFSPNIHPIPAWISP